MYINRELTVMSIIHFYFSYHVQSDMVDDFFPSMNPDNSVKNLDVGVP